MKESLFRKISRHFYARQCVFAQGEYLSLFERLWLSAHIQMALPAQELAEKRINLTANSAEPFFDVGPYKVYFMPKERPKNYDYFMRGIRQVISESFIAPILFWGPVKISAGDVVLDLGGNIGTTALVFSSLVGSTGRVIAFEPVTYATIEKNLTMNKISNVSVVPKAVSNSVGEIEIEISDFFLDSTIAKRERSGDRDGHFTKRLKIPTTTLDDYVRSNGIQKLDFIKMDIEGAEEWALEGAVEVIKRFRPKWSISSYHTDFTNQLQHP